MATYASAKMVERMERYIENPQSALEAQTQLIVDMREALMPTPVNLMYRDAIRAGGSSAIRRGVDIG